MLLEPTESVQTDNAGSNEAATRLAAIDDPFVPLLVANVAPAPGMLPPPSLKLFSTLLAFGGN